MSIILAIETSCDETAVAVLKDGRELLADEVFSQAAIHAGYGGVVPEVASRNHLARLPELVESAIKSAGIARQDIDLVAATAGPGLPAALLVGMAYAKALAIGLGCPFVPVNHVEGHLLSPFFGWPEIPPHLGLVVSGGHTLLVNVERAGAYEVLGSTLDDAAGEAFDKVAKLLGLGYPGGVEIERWAAEGERSAHDFPRAMLHSGNFDFSFSGLKTAVRYLIDRGEFHIPDVCASFQEAVIEVLVRKAETAASARGKTVIGLSGGVSSNRCLQARFEEMVRRNGWELALAAGKIRTDNAAMIAYVAAMREPLTVGARGLAADIFPSFSREQFSGESQLV